MKTLGSSISSLVYGTGVDKKTVNLLAELKWRAERDLARFGVYDDAAKALINKAEARVLAMCHLCESPIEQMMLAALGFMAFDKLDCFPPAIHDVMSGEHWPKSPVVVVPQFVIARYRLDFLVVVESSPRPALIAVECDGKDYHTSREQMLRDEVRDDYLRKVGILTWRMSGFEIHKQQWKMADEIEHLVYQQRKAAA